MDFQNLSNNLWNLQKDIFLCPALSQSNTITCYADLAPEVIESKLGPDSTFIGQHYGVDPNLPKILFIGNNPNSTESDFGTLASVNKVFGRDLKDISAAEFYRTYYTGYKDEKYEFTGLKGFNLFKKPEWSIKRVINDLFNVNSSKRQIFAYTNGVLCKGKGEWGAPAGKMRLNCLKAMRWLRRTLEVLRPEIIFIFSIGQTNSLWSKFTVRNGVIDKEIMWDPYRVEYLCDKGKIKFQSLVFGITHLTTPKFDTWKVKKKQPILFREFLKGYNTSYFSPSRIIPIILDDIRETLKKEGY